MRVPFLRPASHGLCHMGISWPERNDIAAANVLGIMYQTWEIALEGHGLAFVVGEGEAEHVEE